MMTKEKVRSEEQRPVFPMVGRTRVAGDRPMGHTRRVRIRADGAEAVVLHNNNTRAPLGSRDNGSLLRAPADVSVRVLEVKERRVSPQKGHILLVESVGEPITRPKHVCTVQRPMETAGSPQLPPCSLGLSSSPNSSSNIGIHNTQCREDPEDGERELPRR